MPDSHKNELETAWAAGLFEGEGCIHVSTISTRVVLTVAMCDRDVVERFARWAGCGNIGQQNSSNAAHRDIYRWTANGRKARAVIEALLPWLGDRRSLKALEALDAISRLGVPNGEKTHCAQGHEYTPENTAFRKSDKARRCRSCENENNRARYERKMANG